MNSNQHHSQGQYASNSHEYSGKLMLVAIHDFRLGWVNVKLLRAERDQLLRLRQYHSHQSANADQQRAESHQRIHHHPVNHFGANFTDTHPKPVICFLGILAMVWLQFLALSMPSGVALSFVDSM
jgi:hypothetical protein